MDMTFAKNIKQMRKSLRISQEQLADTVGVTKNAVSLWERGESEPRMGIVIKIAQAYGLRLGALMEENGLDDLTSEPIAYLPSQIKAPLYGRIAAGEAVEMIESLEEIGLPSEIAAEHPHGFFLQVSGDSMDKVIKSGGYAFIDPAAEVLNGEIAAINVNGHDATLKRIHRLPNSIILQPESTNPVYKDVMYDINSKDTPHMRIIGKMVWMMYPSGFKY